jgi:hypothetical protein
MLRNLDHPESKHQEQALVLLILEVQLVFLVS